jgi:hypothetical protein
MGRLYSEQGDDFQALHFYKESYKYDQTSLDVITFLAYHYMNAQELEKALTFF